MYQKTGLYITKLELQNTRYIFRIPRPTLNLVKMHTNPDLLEYFWSAFSECFFIKVGNVVFLTFDANRWRTCCYCCQSILNLNQFAWWTENVSKTECYTTMKYIMPLHIVLPLEQRTWNKSLHWIGFSCTWLVIMFRHILRSQTSSLLNFH